jgi:hypothetical protein
VGRWAFFNGLIKARPNGLPLHGMESCPVSWQKKAMPVKSLKETNPHLRNEEKYENVLVTNVISSTAIELGSVPRSITRCLTSSLVDNVRPTGKQVKD